MKYKPEPMNTSAITLPPEVSGLADFLSKNVHEVWAAQKVQDGYTYGPTDSKVLKTHPNLVPYEQLSEADREYDRNTALETIKVLIKLGFVIRK